LPVGDGGTYPEIDVRMVFSEIAEARTNVNHRALASVTWAGSGLNPQALVFLDDVGTHGGLNVSRVVTSSVVVFAEWSGVREAPLIERAERFGVTTGVFPAGLPVLFGAPGAKAFRSDAASGASWTSSNNLTLTAEYDYHGSGLGNQDFSQWLSKGRANPPQAARVWFVRAYASDQIEPLMQHEVFLRADWQDVLPSKLNLGAVAFVATRDRSSLMQLSAQYFVSRLWTISGFLGVTVGSERSVFGSLP
jgi:hypothetical protein